jgi:NAD(P)-dependent dehydrogenase (short-subunit alcohol dehydrogenase family)
MSKPVCLVTGVGPESGTGAEIAKRFSKGGYQVAMLARNAENLAALEAKYVGAKAYPCDVGDLAALVGTIDRVKAEMGAPAVVVHNALRATRGPLLEQDPEDLERNFRVNTTALLYLAQNTLPAMVEAGEGVIMATGNTSATRGKANWGFFASTKASQRILAESIAREFGPQGIHVAVLAPDESDEFFAKPYAIADEMYRVAHQDRSTWSFLVELRPFAENW